MGSGISGVELSGSPTAVLAFSLTTVYNPKSYKYKKDVLLEYVIYIKMTRVYKMCPKFGIFNHFSKHHT
jgi:hypothetical protein